MGNKSKPPTEMTLPTFAADYGFHRYTVFRTCRDEPGLAVKVPHKSPTGRFKYVVLDPERLAVAVRARLERNANPTQNFAGKRPPHGQPPVGEACDGER